VRLVQLQLLRRAERRAAKEAQIKKKHTKHKALYRHKIQCNNQPLDFFFLCSISVSCILLFFSLCLKEYFSHNKLIVHISKSHFKICQTDSKLQADEEFVGKVALPAAAVVTLMHSW
jgi:hypothetical protein